MGLGGFEVDYEVEFVRQFHRQVIRFGALEDPMHVADSAAEEIRIIRSVGHPLTLTHEEGSPTISSASSTWIGSLRRGASGGRVMELPRVGGLHHEYTRRAA